MPDFLSQHSRQQGAGDEDAGEAKEGPASLNRRHCHSFHFQLARRVFAQASASNVNMRRIARVVKLESLAT